MADQNETIKLLKECDAGVKMGIQSLEDVLTGLKDGNLKNILQQSNERHEEIKRHIDKYLKEYQEDGKEPAAIATMMAKMKEGFKMMTEESSCAAANLIIDGCNMGIKSIYKYLNQYPNADKKIQKLVDEIVQEEEQLCKELRAYL